MEVFGHSRIDFKLDIEKYALVIEHKTSNHTCVCVCLYIYQTFDNLTSGRGTGPEKTRS